MVLTKAPMGLVLSVLSKILVLVMPAYWQRQLSCLSDSALLTVHVDHTQHLLFQTLHSFPEAGPSSRGHNF